MNHDWPKLSAERCQLRFSHVEKETVEWRDSWRDSRSSRKACINSIRLFQNRTLLKNVTLNKRASPVQRIGWPIVLRSSLGVPFIWPLNQFNLLENLSRVYLYAVSLNFRVLSELEQTVQCGISSVVI